LNLHVFGDPSIVMELLLQLKMLMRHTYSVYTDNFNTMKEIWTTWGGSRIRCSWQSQYFPTLFTTYCTI